jgi:alpha-tubulin suppressor-like RCC1 family protein
LFLHIQLYFEEEKRMKCSWKVGVMVGLVLVFGAVGWASPGQIYQWGNREDGLDIVPVGDHFTEVAGGKYHALALRSDGSLAGWGYNGNGQTNVPGGNSYVAIAAGENHSIALQSNGLIVGWGDQTSTPSGTFKTIAAGYNYNLALKADDGSLVDWGENRGYELPTDKDFTALSVGSMVCMGLKKTGEIRIWGDDRLITNAPSGSDFIAVAAGDRFCMALKKGGSLVVWSIDFDNLNVTGRPQGDNVPAFAQIAAGPFHSMALTADGTLYSWGLSTSGQCSPPLDKKFSTIAAGGWYSTGIEVPEPATVGFLTLGCLAFILRRKRA